MPKQFLWKELADFSVLSTSEYQDFSLMALSVTCLKNKNVSCMLLKLQSCCGFNDKTFSPIFLYYFVHNERKKAFFEQGKACN